MSLQMEREKVQRGTSKAAQAPNGTKKTGILEQTRERAGEHIGVCSCGWVYLPEHIGALCGACGKGVIYRPEAHDGLVTLPEEAFANIEAEYLKYQRLPK